MIKKILDKIYMDKTFLKFAAVGVINTLVGYLIMFVFYNFLNCSYSISTAANCFLTSVLSYFLNKRFTFNNNDKGISYVIKFALNIALCYFIAYGMAQPAVSIVLTKAPKKVKDNISMIVGMGLFTVLNYFGQRLIVFNKKDN